MSYMTDPVQTKNIQMLIKSIEELSVTLLGCDSSARWAMKYKHLQMTKTVSEVINRIIVIVTQMVFVGPHGEDIHLVITGGEPTRVATCLVHPIDRSQGLWTCKCYI